MTKLNFSHVYLINKLEKYLQKYDKHLKHIW